MKIFLSHSSQDKGLVDGLRRALEVRGCAGWLDVRQLRGGDILPDELKRAIEEANAFVLFVSPASLQSDWVGEELRHALEIQRQRREDGIDYRVVPLGIDGTKLGVLKQLFDGEPVYIEVSSGPGGVEAAIPALEAALGVRLPQVQGGMAAADERPQEELVLELSRLDFFEEGGVRRGQGEAKLVYQPADSRRRAVESEPFVFRAPLGPIEMEDLRWYLEEYAVWPGGYVEEKARRIEGQLEAWGQVLYKAAVPSDSAREVLNGWSQVHARAVRRFSVQVDKGLPKGTEQARVDRASEAATSLLGLPWELLHDGAAFLFQGRKPVRVRRRLPNTRDLDVAAVGLPIRVLLVTARPEDEACGYIDHRASAEPLVRAVESLGGLVELTLLGEPTFAGLVEELQRAEEADEPYHVLHFDGHGVFSKREGLGGLCFEDLRDVGKLVKRRHQTVYTDELGKALRDYRIPLVFLEACQTAQAEEDKGSVASELLRAGVASVVAMSHSVLVATAWRFVESFYKGLAEGKRVGDAMLEGQQRLYDDDFRLRTFSGDLHLQDWFVPVLFQEAVDPRLFERVPGDEARRTTAELLAARLAHLPKEPDTGFIGRSRALLALERLLIREPYGVIRGQGGEGKTALAAELARWLVRSQRLERAAFVSVEGLEVKPAAAVLDALGRQLLPADTYSVAEYSDLEEALPPVERALAEARTVVVLDNLESLLLPPWMQPDEALAADARADLEAVLALCQRLGAVGATRLVFTTRERLPDPFGEEGNCIELGRLDRDEAVQFIERVLEGSEGVSVAGQRGAARLDTDAATREAIEALIEAVQGHARTLSLLAPHVQAEGVEQTRVQLTGLMQRMHADYPDSREQSLFASVELSLGRLSAVNRERVEVLGVFHGELDLDVLRVMMEWERDDVASLGGELVESGLATAAPYNHLRLHPALCPYLQAGLDADRRVELEGRWTVAMRAFIEFLVQQADQDAQLAATLTVLELPNAMALLDRVQAAGDAEATIDLTTDLYRLVQNLGRPRVLAKIGSARDAAAGGLAGERWSHARFEAQRTQIEQQLAAGQLATAHTGARQLHQRALAEGESAYARADYDIAVACLLLGRVLNTGGAAAQALPLLKEAQGRFEAIAERRDSLGAALMASNSLAEQGDCLLALGQLDAAAAAYEEKIQRAEKLDDRRQVATGEFQLGIVRLHQRRYDDALTAYQEARETFAALGEPLTVAGSWHQIGMVHQEACQSEAAEQAYRQSLAIRTQEGDVRGQASSLTQLGNLYKASGRFEDAASFYQQAISKDIELGDARYEGIDRSNLADTLRQLGRYDEARSEIRRAITSKEPFGHAAELWKTWDILQQIEEAEGNAPAAAQARAKALDLYLAYRRDGGENHSGIGRLCHAVTAAMLGQADDAPSIETLKPQLEQLLAQDEGWNPLVPLLLQIIDGTRDRTLAEHPDLRYDAAAELHVLLDQLEAAGTSGGQG